jgi:hypothetical protein
MVNMVVVAYYQLINMSFVARRITRRTFSTSLRRMGGGGILEGQRAPTYVPKFLKEPPTVAVSSPSYPVIYALNRECQVIGCPFRCDLLHCLSRQ